MFICEITIIIVLIFWKLELVRPIQQKLPLPNANNKNYNAYLKLQTISGIQAVGKSSIPVLVPTIGHTNNNFQVFFFQLCFNKKYVIVAINDVTMYIIISEWLRIQKCIQKRKAMRQSEAKEETVSKSVFIHLTVYQITRVFTFSFT